MLPERKGGGKRQKKLCLVVTRLDCLGVHDEAFERPPWVWARPFLAVHRRGDHGVPGRLFGDSQEKRGAGGERLCLPIDGDINISSPVKD